jgi:glycosyltransferase involved in cell wall biosynthesis
MKNRKCWYLSNKTMKKSYLFGGNRHENRLLSFLENSFDRIENISFDNALQIVFSNILFSNLWILRFFIHIKKHDAIICSQSIIPRSILFLLFLKIRKIKVFSLVNHLKSFDTENKKKKHLWNLLEKNVYKFLSSHLIVISKSTLIEVVKLGVSSKKITVLYPAFFNQPNSHVFEKRKKSKQINLLFVGSCRPIKGILYLIDAMNKLKMKSIVLNIIGNINVDPEYTKLLHRSITENSLENNIILHGDVCSRKLAEFYHRSDIFVLPSLWEGFGMVLLEAMANKLPIIATNVGAVPELVKHKKNGLLVPSKCSKSIANAINYLLVNVDLAKKMGNHGYYVSTSWPTWDFIGKKFEQIIVKK